MMCWLWRMDTLKKHLPFSGQEGLHELKKIAEKFEEKIYTAATSQVLPYFCVSLFPWSKSSFSQMLCVGILEFPGTHLMPCVYLHIFRLTWFVLFCDYSSPTIYGKFHWRCWPWRLSLRTPYPILCQPTLWAIITDPQIQVNRWRLIGYIWYKYY